MPAPKFLTIYEQVAEHLREELFCGRWSETIPGLPSLAAELGVNVKTVELALKRLENEGLLVGQGPGRRRRIILPGGTQALRQLRVAFMVLEISDSGHDLLIELRHLLEKAGHQPFFPSKTLLDLGMDARRVARFVKQTEADAWVICAGSREVLEWFCSQPGPAFALFGRRDGLPIAGVGPDKSPAMAEATRHLIELGHRRISFLVRRQHRHPNPTPSVRAFLDVLEVERIRVGDFNLPDWKETKAGFQEILKSLFQLTPPTALILDEPFLFNAALYFLGKKGLRVPEDVSLICTDADPSCAWCEPSVAHIRWDYSPVVNRIVRWANNVSRSKKDLRQMSTKAEFVKGGTIGVAKGD